MRRSRLRRESAWRRDPPGGRGGLSRRGLLKAGGGVAFAGVSIAALKLPFFSTDGAQQDPADVPRRRTCRRPQKALIVSNWPQYIDPTQGRRLDAARSSRSRPGSRSTYTDDVNDNAEFYAKVQNQLGACEPIEPRHDDADRLDGGADDRAGLDPAARPGEGPQRRTKNLIDPLRNRQWDPDLEYHAPWQSGLTGIAYNAAKTGEVKSFEELLTRADLKGRVTLLSEMRDTMGFMLKVIGADPDKFTDDEWDERDRPAPEGRRPRPDPGVHRQRVHPGPRGRQHPGLRGLVGRRDPAPVRQPGHQVRRRRRRGCRSGATT